MAGVATVLINLTWTFYNIVISAASVAVAAEARQIRAEPRVYAELPAALSLANGKTIVCRTNNFSQRGIGIALPEGAAGLKARVALPPEGFGDWNEAAGLLDPVRA